MEPKKTGTFGSRLRQEREALGLSQVEMAEKLGITARSQRNYETGTRVPDAEYLMAASRIGVDLIVLLHGEEATRQEHFEWNDVSYVIALEKAFGIKHEDFEQAVELSLVNDDLCVFDPEILFLELRRHSPVIRVLIERESGLDTVLLAGILMGVESALHLRQLTMVPDKKAQAVAMLYRSFKASGKVDPAMIEEAVKLAAS
ncbi:MAG: helix-turn-helix transcriptional regulator [Candidatus Accumulibacter necessarius]|jgi:transcriptional regulator with XRE-family HTH domain|uniref:helix-turn-helix domain-containing protein n=1 Tax=Candidatus Accumulibacter necessarius TaxID=2954386 RepID=UPI002FC2A06A